MRINCHPDTEIVGAVAGVAIEPCPIVDIAVAGRRNSNRLRRLVDWEVVEFVEHGAFLRPWLSCVVPAAKGRPKFARDSCRYLHGRVPSGLPEVKASVVERLFAGAAGHLQEERVAPFGPLDAEGGEHAHQDAVKGLAPIVMP